MTLPAGETTTHSYSYPIPQEMVFYMAGHHMHTLGDSARLWIDREGGNETCLLSDSDWDFNWHRLYTFSEPVVAHPGDALNIECTWTNNTTEDVTWGEGTEDEMCLGFLLMTAAPADNITP
jgi:hypothetical protein